MNRHGTEAGMTRHKRPPSQAAFVINYVIPGASKAPEPRYIFPAGSTEAMVILSPDTFPFTFTSLPSIPFSLS
jgi:hypothetical protein